MHVQALGESVIRKALEELQVWGLERRFTLYKFSSTAGTGWAQTPPLANAGCMQGSYMHPDRMHHNLLHT